MKSGPYLSIVLSTALLAAGCSMDSLHAHMAGPHGGAHGSDAQPVTVDIQGADEWKRSPHMRAYYDLTAATFAHGTDIDVDAYEAKSFALFREFGDANGGHGKEMVDHLKLIPRQVVSIVKEDPKVLSSYDAFWAAVAGPD